MLKKVPFGQQVVFENVGRVDNVSSRYSDAYVAHDMTRFLKSGGFNNDVELTNAPASNNRQTAYSNLSARHIFNLKPANVSSKFEMVPLTFIGGKSVPSARVYITNPRGDQGVAATDLEGNQGNIAIVPLTDDFDTPMAQWWIIPTEAAFPNHPNIAGGWVIRSFAGNGMFLSSEYNTYSGVEQPGLRRIGAYNGGKDSIDVWRINRCALESRSPPRSPGRTNTIMSTPFVHRAISPDATHSTLNRSHTNNMTNTSYTTNNTTVLNRSGSLYNAPSSPIAYSGYGANNNNDSSYGNNINTTTTTTTSLYGMQNSPSRGGANTATQWAERSNSDIAKEGRLSDQIIQVNYIFVNDPVPSQTYDPNPQLSPRTLTFWGCTLNEKNAKVQEMWHDGPGYRAGIRPNDQIVRVAGVDVSNYDETLTEMKKTKVGHPSSITVLKPEGNYEQYQITPLTNRSEFQNERDIYYDTSKTTTNYKIPTQVKREINAPPFFGVTLNENNGRVKEMWHDGPGYKAGIRPGDQIVRWAGVDVSNYVEILQQMKKTKVGQSNTITVLKGDTGKKERYNITPMTDKSVYKNEADIYFDRNKHYRIQETPQEPSNYSFLS